METNFDSIADNISLYKDMRELYKLIKKTHLRYSDAWIRIFHIDLPDNNKSDIDCIAIVPKVGDTGDYISKQCKFIKSGVEKKYNLDMCYCKYGKFRFIGFVPRNKGESNLDNDFFSACIKARIDGDLYTHFESNDSPPCRQTGRIVFPIGSSTSKENKREKEPFVCKFEKWQIDKDDFAPDFLTK